MVRYVRHLTQPGTPQSQRAAPGQRENSAGGYTFILDDWAALNRWLVLGAEGGTYYATEKKLTRDNAKTIVRCLDRDGPRTVARIVEISSAGRAPKNDPAIFALAMAAGHHDPATRGAALQAIPQVCRIGTHLLSFVDTVREFRGWGRGLRAAICRWYLERDARDLAYQVVKYQQRGGMSHRDVLRLAGGAMAGRELTEAQRAVLRWIVAGADFGPRLVERRSGGGSLYGAVDPSQLPELIAAYEAVKAAEPAAIPKLVTDHRLTHEMVPAEHKGRPDVWAALLPHLPFTAMLRNLGRLSSLGLLGPLSDAARLVRERLEDRERLRRARVHPLALLVALETYRRGRGVRGSLTWTPVGTIVDALDEAFYTAFDLVEPTRRKRLIALDVSGSMGYGNIAGMPGITPRVGSAAMAMTTMRTEANWHVLAFASAKGHHWNASDPDDGLVPLDLSATLRLDEVIGRTAALPFGGTDCALPMRWATKHRVELDAIEIYTDNETWAGETHPHQALEEYRQSLGRPCKLAVVGMTATRFSIADPTDPGMMDVVGFDSATPRVLADFVVQGA